MAEKKSKNSKPILSILIDDDKRKRFAHLAGQHKLSMGWLVNQAIDKMLMADSIYIYKDSLDSTEVLNNTSVDNVDELVRASIEKHLEDVSGYLPLDAIECMAIGVIDKYLDEKILAIRPSDLSTIDTEVMLNTSIHSINAEIEVIRKRLGLSEQLASSQGEKIEQLKKPLEIG